MNKQYSVPVALGLSIGDLFSWKTPLLVKWLDVLKVVAIIHTRYHWGGGIRCE